MRGLVVCSKLARLCLGAILVFAAAACGDDEGRTRVYTLGGFDGVLDEHLHRVFDTAELGEARVEDGPIVLDGVDVDALTAGQWLTVMRTYADGQPVMLVHPDESSLAVLAEALGEPGTVAEMSGGVEAVGFRRTEEQSVHALFEAAPHGDDLDDHRLYRATNLERWLLESAVTLSAGAESSVEKNLEEIMAATIREVHLSYGEATTKATFYGWGIFSRQEHADYYVFAIDTTISGGNYSSQSVDYDFFSREVTKKYADDRYCAGEWDTTGCARKNYITEFFFSLDPRAVASRLQYSPDTPRESDHFVVTQGMEISGSAEVGWEEGGPAGSVGVEGGISFETEHEYTVESLTINSTAGADGKPESASWRYELPLARRGSAKSCPETRALLAPFAVQRNTFSTRLWTVYRMTTEARQGVEAFELESEMSVSETTTEMAWVLQGSVGDIGCNVWGCECTQEHSTLRHERHGVVSYPLVSRRSPEAPRLSGIDPAVGAPGEVITLQGENLTGATAVSFGAATVDSPDHLHVVSDTALEVRVPDGPSGKPVRVSVSAPGGLSNTVGFVYED